MASTVTCARSPSRTFGEAPNGPGGLDVAEERFPDLPDEAVDVRKGAQNVKLVPR